MPLPILLATLFPKKLLILGAVGISLAIGGYAYGTHKQIIKNERAVRVAVEKALQESLKLSAAQLKVTEQYYAEQIKNNVRIQTQKVFVDRFVESDQGKTKCLDEDGIALVNTLLQKDSE